MELITDEKKRIVKINELRKGMIIADVSGHYQVTEITSSFNSFNLKIRNIHTGITRFIYTSSLERAFYLIKKNRSLAGSTFSNSPIKGQGPVISLFGRYKPGE